MEPRPFGRFSPRPKADPFILGRADFAGVHADEAPAAPPAVLDAVPAVPREEPGTSPSDTTRAVGGLLIGAAFAALAPLFAPDDALQPALVLALATAALGAAHLAERARGALVAEAGFAAALVAAACVPFAPGANALASALAAALIVVITLLREGRTPLALAAVPAFVVCARDASGAPRLRGVDALAELAFLFALVAYGALLLRQSRIVPVRISENLRLFGPSGFGAERPEGRAAPPSSSTWAPRALALHGAAIALAVLPLLDALRISDAGIAALAVGAALGALFALGIALDARFETRPLVATTGIALAFAAAAFALLALGPALAAIVLLLMGAALVWRADHVRTYFRARDAA